MRGLALPVALSMALAAAACAPLHPEPRLPPADVVYDYPLDNPWAATVVGTPAALRAELPDPRPREDLSLTVFEDRRPPEGFWYHRGLRYTLLRQEGRAPLVFVVAGTGADHRSRLMTVLGRILHAAGLHVVLLPSPTHANFIVTASSTYLPGHAATDAADLYRVMGMIRDAVADRVEVSAFHLAGYSLGAWHAAFTAELDEREGEIGFDRVLLINPPLGLYGSIRAIEDMLTSNLPGGIDGLDRFLDDALRQFSRVYQTTDALEFEGDDLLRETYERLQPGDDSLAAAIGLSFRLASANMAFTSDVMGGWGYVYPRGRPFRSTTPLDEYLAVSLRTSFLDYFEDVYADFHGRPGPDGRPDREGLVADASLEAIAGFIQRRGGRIGMTTNEDDVILGPGDLDGLRRLFGPSARVFPNGGHMGNLEHRAVAGHIARFFTDPL